MTLGRARLPGQRRAYGHNEVMTDAMTDHATTSLTAFVGAGAMGEAILAGLLRSGRAVESVLVVEKRVERAEELTEAHGVRVVDDLTAVHDAATVLVAVKPQDLPAVLTEMAPSLRPGQMVVSVAAGVTLAQLASYVPEGVAVVRVMPNTPSVVGAGMSAVTPGSSCTPQQVAEAEELMASCGEVVVVDEAQMDGVTGLSGSGPAYVFLVVDALVEAGVHQGLARDVARQLAVQTVLGSAQLLKETGMHPALAREQVTSPGGTTAAALRELDERGVRAALVAAVAASAGRSAQMAADD